MNIGLVIVIVVVALLVLLAIYVASTYNALVHTRNLVKDQWAQVDVLLKRRADLIPNIVETVKGYAKHEKETLDAVITARNKAVSANSQESQMQANGELTQALGRLLALSEAYPDLKANTNFLKLQDELGNTENKIASARQFYNDAALKLKNKIEMFPSNIIASMFGFKAEPFFEVDDQAKEAPKVSF